ncbi:NAD(P)/FAD-dependent oxidoreductase [Gloeothece verrucosa]|uniref:FAD-dependent pyridine nucleotide-disulfide oxidoreductase n=1 Tax=Gloeothece verrucosa (strain PCC 7822) TaxID=497965 RepID=E0UIC9_GLOV7|nr:FAD/NAD(P)-binding oxidoreductase [Gloeothece verrucosa]ADN16897.1 FAD-dependent pyridine nucleotide-disulfide oxidoreductase [Gloeothece verrucosa PCC 7822]
MQTTASSTDLSSKTVHHQIVIIGGGAGGITVAAQLLRQNSKLDIAIIEPSDKHFYQPAWTLVGAGQYHALDTVKDEQELIPAQAKWLKDYVEKLDPDNNLVVTHQGTQVFYDYLVVAAGIQIDWHLIKGLPEALGKGGVCSNYIFEIAPYTWELLNNFAGGNAIFTFPATPIKCAGAPQKIMYLADDIFRKNGVRQKTKITYCAATAKIFAVDAYAPTLMKVVERKGIDLKFKHNLKEIKADSKEAVFDVSTDGGVQEVTLPYDLIHVAPPMSAPDFIKNSKLATPAAPALGWVDVHKHTLQHKVYPNVFSLGDASSLPTSKTAAAVRGEAPVLVENLLAFINKQALNGYYNGYTCCPLVTGIGKTIMAEFDYDGNPISTFPIDQTQEHYTMWLMKKYALPWVYWNRMLKGQAFEGSFLRKLQGKK